MPIITSQTSSRRGCGLQGEYIWQRCHYGLGLWSLLPANPSATRQPRDCTCRRVPIGIGAGSTISNTIVDKNARIGENCTIVNKEGIEEANKEDEGFYIRSGIVTVRRTSRIQR